MKTIFKNLLLLAFSLLFGFLVLEIGVRLVFARKPYELPLFQARPGGASYTLLPDRAFPTQIEGRPALIQIDAFGNVGHAAIPPQRTPGVRRIAVLGDSFPFGLWASDADHAMIGLAAAATKDQQIEWVNFAVPGYGYPDMRLRLENEVLQWNPDVVLLCTFNGNDIRETYLGPNQTIVTDGIALPNHALWREKLPADLLPPEPKRPLARIMVPLRRASQAINLAIHVLDGLKRPPDSASDSNARPQTLYPSPYFTSFSFWNRTDSPPLQAEAIQVALGELGDIADLCRQHNITLAIAAIPTQQQVDTENMQGPNYDLDLPQRRIAAFCADRNLAWLDMLPAFRDAARQSDAPLYCLTDPHFNDAGHAVAGQLLAAFATNTLFPQP